MKLILDPKDWHEPRFEAMRCAMGWSQAEALGVLILFWHGTREDEIIDATEERLRTYLPVQPEKSITVFSVLRTVGYVTRRKHKGGEDTWEVWGNDAAVSMTRKRREWGKLGAKKSAGRPKKHKPTPKPPPDPAVVAAKAETAAKKAANVRCWDAYRTAYLRRYQCEPLRDAKVNVMISQFVTRIGQERAPAIIQFFVELDEPRYIHGAHALNLALRDAEALCTQWQVGPLAQNVRTLSQEPHTRNQLQRVARGDL